MDRVVDFLREAAIYYLATVDGDQARVRPFDTIGVFEGRLYIQTDKVKDVSGQIHRNPKVEICALKETLFDRNWLRVAGTLIEDDRWCAKKAMLDACPKLKRIYSAEDINMEVFYFTDSTAVFHSLTKKPEIIIF